MKIRPDFGMGYSAGLMQNRRPRIDLDHQIVGIS